VDLAAANSLLRNKRIRGIYERLLGSNTMCALSAHADGTNPAMPIQAREESVLHAYLGAMQTIASPYR
jgi:hypothetical protein